MFYRLMPTLIEKGYVYIAESPLFEFTVNGGKGKEKSYFAFDEGEKQKLIKSLRGKNTQFSAARVWARTSLT